MRAIIHTAFAIAALLLAGVIADTVRAAPRDGLRRSLSSYIAQERHGQRIHSAVLLQLSDCEGNLRMLDMVHHPAVREQLRLAVIWYAGPTSDSTAIRKLLPAWSRQIPLAPAPTLAVKELAQLGHRSTPLLIVLDQEGRVRFTTQSPRGAREFAGLRSIIVGLTWIEEL